MTIQAGTVLIFGIGTPATTYGLLQSYEINSRVNRATAKAPDGSTVSIQEHGDTENLSLTYLPVAAGTGGPEIGSTFTFDSTPWQIDNIREGNIVDGFQTMEVEASYYPLIH
jgi:hypothetical protein